MNLVEAFRSDRRWMIAAILFAFAVNQKINVSTYFAANL